MKSATSLVFSKKKQKLAELKAEAAVIDSKIASIVGESPH